MAGFPICQPKTGCIEAHLVRLRMLIPVYKSEAWRGEGSTIQVPKSTTFETTANMEMMISSKMGRVLTTLVSSSNIERLPIIINNGCKNCCKRTQRPCCGVHLCTIMYKNSIGSPNSQWLGSWLFLTPQAPLADAENGARTAWFGRHRLHRGGWWKFHQPKCFWRSMQV